MLDSTPRLCPRIRQYHASQLIQGPSLIREEGHPFGMSHPGQAVSSLSVPSLMFVMLCVAAEVVAATIVGGIRWIRINSFACTANMLAYEVS